MKSENFHVKLYDWPPHLGGYCITPVFAEKRPLSIMTSSVTQVSLGHQGARSSRQSS